MEYHLVIEADTAAGRLRRSFTARLSELEDGSEWAVSRLEAVRRRLARGGRLVGNVEVKLYVHRPLLGWCEVEA